jgi:hypothetical protein
MAANVQILFNLHMLPIPFTHSYQVEMEHLHALADLFEASLPFEHLLAAAKLQKNTRLFSVPDHQSMRLIEKPTFPV